MPSPYMGIPGMMGARHLLGASGPKAQISSCGSIINTRRPSVGAWFSHTDITLDACSLYGNPRDDGSKASARFGPTLSLCSFALLTGTRQTTLVTSLAISATNEARLEDCNETMTQYDSYRTPERSSIPKTRQNGSVDHKTSRSSAPRNRRCSDRTMQYQ